MQPPAPQQLTVDLDQFEDWALSADGQAVLLTPKPGSESPPQDEAPGGDG